MEQLLRILERAPEFQTLSKLCRQAQPAAMAGLSQINRSHIIAALYRALDRPMVVLCQDEMAMSRTAEELCALLSLDQIPALEGRDLTLYDAAVVSHQWEQRRLRQLYDLASGKTKLQLMCASSCSLRTMPKQILLASALELAPGMQIEPSALAHRLTRIGYSRCELVEGAGQFAVRGGIVDIFSPAEDAPVRVEFFGDEIDAMGTFNPLTQRRVENVETLTVLPVRECLAQLHPQGVDGLCADLRALLGRLSRRRRPNEQLLETIRQDLEKLETQTAFAGADRYLALIYPELTTALDYVNDRAVIVFNDSGNLRRAVRRYTQQLGEQLDGLLQNGTLAGELCDFARPWEELCGQLPSSRVVYLDAFLPAQYPEQLPPKKIVSVTAKQLPPFGSNLGAAASDLEFYRRQKHACVVLCANSQRGHAMQEFLREKEIPSVLCFEKTPELFAPGVVYLCEGNLPAGMEYPELKFTVLAQGRLMQRKAGRRLRSPVKASNRQKLNSFADLTPGDLVVHAHHGIGRYEAMEQFTLDGVVKDYVKISYQGTDVLYVPATQLDLVSKYIGSGDGENVRLNRLGGDAWEKTKARAKSAAKDMAAKLIKLYAERKRLPGYAFSPDTPWQAEFESGFEYEETDDQLRCVAEIKADMERPTPMDRLLCGDVGFGKTEVALRSAMKAMLDSKQVAILVPTTVLAQQHYLTAQRRFAAYPVNIQVLSRFQTPAAQKKILAGLADGSVDLIIGTHKLLQKAVTFKNLGLLIVDEEQRFGVSHKERLKELAAGVDVLTLSATPIPRTLNMALTGLRDMSTIEEPPQDRYPVQTFVLEYDRAVLDDAMRRELARGGQVYYLHNDISSIESVAARIREHIPDAQIAVAHGKMKQDELSEVMQRLVDGEIEILVCTTIIETGIDVPNVNTLIIENADRFGLAQLHQLRGRVGRSNRHAFAYLTFRPGRALTETAEKRLTAIRDFAAFGSGFKIAMRDLEIRGAGNLLGAEQSGHMTSVGYDMYLQLLEDAVLEERGETRAKPAECTADLAVAANIDERYVHNAEQKMDLYRRMAAIRTQDDADELLDEIVDRYGDPPKPILNLIGVALLRAEAAQAGIADIAQKANQISFTLEAFRFEAVSRLAGSADWRGRLRILPKTKQPVLQLQLRTGDAPLSAAQAFVRAYAAACAADCGTED